MALSCRPPANLTGCPAASPNSFAAYHDRAAGRKPSNWLPSGGRTAPMPCWAACTPRAWSHRVGLAKRRPAAELAQAKLLPTARVCGRRQARPGRETWKAARDLRGLERPMPKGTARAASVTPKTRKIPKGERPGCSRCPTVRGSAARRMAGPMGRERLWPETNTNRLECPVAGPLQPLVGQHEHQ